jgi:ribosomal protein S18 acetylase RimI-like enzyme
MIAGARDASGVEEVWRRHAENAGISREALTDDYAEVIENRRVTVAESEGTIVGVIVLAIDNEGFFVDNVAVDPSRRGEGLGKALLKLAEAEARHAGFDSIHLYTHEKMTENLAIYSRLGYVGYDRRFRDKITLIFMTKRLG